MASNIDDLKSTELGHLRMTHSMFGLPLYPAGHLQVGLWAIVWQIAVGAHSSLLQGSIQVRDRRSHARLVGQS